MDSYDAFERIKGLREKSLNPFISSLAKQIVFTICSLLFKYAPYIQYAYYI